MDRASSASLRRDGGVESFEHLTARAVVSPTTTQLNDYVHVVARSAEGPLVGATSVGLGLNSAMRSQRWRRVMPALQFSMDTSSWSVRACVRHRCGALRLRGSLLRAFLAEHQP